MRARFLDAQQALAFLVPQTAHIEAGVYATRYPDIRYPQLIPIDTSANPWVQSILFYSTDMVGRADWFNVQSQDIPQAEVVRSQFQTGVRMGAIGYNYNIEEISIAQMLNQNLTADKANAARRASEEFIDQVALFGDAKVGFEGLINASTPTVVPSPGNGAGASPLWANKTADQILAEVNADLTGIYLGTNTVEMADTILLPIDRYTKINTTRLTDVAQVTIMEWLMRNNVYTQETGQQLTIRAVRGLDTAGAGGVARMVTYRRDPSVVKMHIPMPFRFWPVWPTSPFVYEVPGTFRVGGTEIRRPSAVRYRDGL